MNRLELITRPDRHPTALLSQGVELHVLATGSLGARGLTTSLAAFHPAAELPYHRHPFSEVIVVLDGDAVISVEGRRYHAGPYDAMHVPAGVAHAVRNASSDGSALLHSSFASDSPTRESAAAAFPVVDREQSDHHCPETMIRFNTAPVYELSTGAHFRDLFAKRFGSRGICGGYGLFGPGASLPCHFHEYDESITIIQGTAVCQAAGREYELADCSTACIPRGRPHRFLNRSDARMAMIWVYAGDEPERTLVEAGYCSGTISIDSLRNNQ
jgi:quercetin dioxygenase-like cupin family protein